MDFKKNERKFKKLSQRIKKNRKRIAIFKKGASLLMIVFILTSFISIYTNNVLQGPNSLKLLFYIVLFVSFAIMLAAHIFIINKVKENKKLDTKIYYLMKLKL